MSENVVSLYGSAESDAKSEFMRYVSDAFDDYVSRADQEPEAIVVCWGGFKQDNVVGWFLRGESEPYGATVKALASASLMKAIINPGFDE